MNELLYNGGIAAGGPMSKPRTRRIFEPEMVRIPAGTFRMGSNPGEVANVLKDWKHKEEELEREQPAHLLELPEYLIGKYPVTNREFRHFVKENLSAAPNNPSASPSGWIGAEFPSLKRNHPVVNVTWDQVVAYCRWLSTKTGKPYRLPTEAEWEKAARGPEGRIYPWGDVYDPLENVFDHKFVNVFKGVMESRTSPVGQFSPQGDSPYGCADMAGNVWDWTSSLLKPYPYRSDDGREDLQSREYRVQRGGSYGAMFDLHLRYIRCAARGYAWPDHFAEDRGFRVCLPRSDP